MDRVEVILGCTINYHTKCHGNLENEAVAVNVHFQTEDLSVSLIKKQTTYSPPEPIGHPNEERMNKIAKKVLIPTGTWLDMLGLAIQSGMFM